MQEMREHAERYDHAGGGCSLTASSSLCGPDFRCLIAVTCVALFQDSGPALQARLNSHLRCRISIPLNPAIRGSGEQWAVVRVTVINYRPPSPNEQFVVFRMQQLPALTTSGRFVVMKNGVGVVQNFIAQRSNAKAIVCVVESYRQLLIKSARLGKYARAAHHARCGNRRVISGTDEAA